MHSPSSVTYPLSHSSINIVLFYLVVFVLFLFWVHPIMEPQQQQQQQNEDGGSSGIKGGFGNSSSSSSRQSSTRWTPTSDQIRILKDLYYNNGIRSPSAEQIQRISARLRQYGKIEGKNVFYWFQNHKARERQKKRFTSDHVPMQLQRSAPTTTNANIWKNQPEDHLPLHSHTTKYSNINIPPTGLSSASAEMVTVGQVGNYGYGSVPMEKSFRDCSISAGSSSGPHVGSGINNHHHLGWVGHVDPYSSAAYANLFDKIRPTEEEQEEEDDDDDNAPEIETLPLFPMHGDDIHGYCNLKSSSSNYDGGWYHHHHHHQAEEHGFINASRTTATSLELTLNSYSRRSPDYYA